MLQRVAQEAGEIILGHFEEGMAFHHDIKADGTPVSIADRDAEIHIQKALAGLGIPVVGEETAADGIEYNLSGGRYFLIDPLDGTREFIKGGSEWTINIAFIDNNIPEIGIVYAPALNQLFYAYGPETATRVNTQTGKEKQIHTRRPLKSGITIAASKNRDREQVEAFAQNYHVQKTVRIGSALKICAIAAGDADIYPCFGPTCEWDTAAGQAVLHAAGGVLESMNGAPLMYGKTKDGFKNPSFVARTADVPLILP